MMRSLQTDLRKGGGGEVACGTVTHNRRRRRRAGALTAAAKDEAPVSTTPDAPSQLRYDATPGFIRILDITGCSLAVSVYLQNRVLLVCADAGKLLINSCEYQRPMGLAATVDDGTTHLAIATLQEVVILADAPLLAPSVPGDPDAHEHLLVPRATLFCGDIDAHDLVWLKGRLYAVNTRFSCLAAIDHRYSFTPVWHPPFVTQLMLEDRCHLNGVAIADDRIAYVTALGLSDTARGWSPNRATGGLLLDVESGEPVLQGLSMPHSPRVFDGRLHVMESGTGRVLQVDAREHSARTLAELPGFVRGCDRLGDILFVGLSRIREQVRISLPIHQRQADLICGIAAVERDQGRVLGWLRFDDAFEEIFDVKVLPNFRRSGMLSATGNIHRRALALPGRAFWGENKDDSSIPAFLGC